MGNMSHGFNTMTQPQRLICSEHAGTQEVFLPYFFKVLLSLSPGRGCTTDLTWRAPYNAAAGSRGEAVTAAASFNTLDVITQLH